MRLVAILLAVSVLVGCASSRDAAVTAGLFGKDNEGEPTVPTLDLPQLIEANHKMAQALIEESNNANMLSHGANGLLLVSTVNVALSGGLGSGSDTSNELIYALGLSQGIRYANPQVAANTFSIAADRSACIAARAAQIVTQRSATSGDSTPIDSRNADVRSALWEMTVRVQTDLRRNLIRPNLSVIKIVTGIFARSEEEELAAKVSVLENQQRALADRNQIIADLGAAEGKASPRYQLLGCFVANAPVSTPSGG